MIRKMKEVVKVNIEKIKLNPQHVMPYQISEQQKKIEKMAILF